MIEPRLHRGIDFLARNFAGVIQSPQRAQTLTAAFDVAPQLFMLQTSLTNKKMSFWKNLVCYQAPCRVETGFLRNDI